MQKQKLVSKFVIGSGLAITLLFSVTAFAWTGPTGTPPTNNTAAPIDTSGIAQTKSGNFTANVFAANTIGVPGNSGGAICIGVSCLTSWQWTTVGNDIYYNSGNVGIATTTPTTALTVGGTITAPALTGLSAPINPTDAANKAYVDAAGGGGGSGLNYCQITANTYTGNLGGISGANAKCAAEFGNGWTFATVGKFAAYISSAPNIASTALLWYSYTPPMYYYWTDPTGGVLAPLYPASQSSCSNWSNSSVTGTVILDNGGSGFLQMMTGCIGTRPLICCNF